MLTEASVDTLYSLPGFTAEGCRVQAPFQGNGAGLLLHLQVIRDREYTRDAVSLDVCNILVQLVSYNSRQGHVSVLHNDVNGGNGLQSISLQRCVPIDGTIDSQTDAVVVG